MKEDPSKTENIRRDLLRKARRIVVKLGSSVLVEKGVGLDLVTSSKSAKQIS